MVTAFADIVSAMRGGESECHFVGYNDSKHNSQLINSGPKRLHVISRRLLYKA